MLRKKTLTQLRALSMIWRLNMRKYLGMSYRQTTAELMLYAGKQTVFRYAINALNAQVENAIATGFDPSLMEKWL